MSKIYKEIIKIPPIPASKKDANLQVRYFQKRIQEKGIDAVKAEAIDTIYNTCIKDEPSELKRLRILYQDVYTRDELEKMIDTTFKNLGLTSD